MVPDQCVYLGKIMHQRMIPKVSKFEYKVFSVFIDLDKIENTISSLNLMSFNKFGLLSFFNKDHGPRDGSKLRNWVDRKLYEKNRPEADQVFLLCFPRMYGYVFNPISVYFCYNSQKLSSVICEVKNTFGDQVIYVLSSEKYNEKVIRAFQKKEMYVSPFIEMEQIYSFLILPPSKKLSLSIKQKGYNGVTLIAKHDGIAYPLNDNTLLRCVLSHPLMTLKVILAIHWQALKLFFRGIKYIRYPGKFELRKNNKK